MVDTDLGGSVHGKIKPSDGDWKSICAQHLVFAAPYTVYQPSAEKMGDFDIDEDGVGVASQWLKMFGMFVAIASDAFDKLKEGNKTEDEQLNHVPIKVYLETVPAKDKKKPFAEMRLHCVVPEIVQEETDKSGPPPAASTLGVEGGLLQMANTAGSIQPLEGGNRQPARSVQTASEDTNEQQSNDVVQPAKVKRDYFQEALRAVFAANKKKWDLHHSSRDIRKDPLFALKADCKYHEISHIGQWLETCVSIYLNKEFTIDEIDVASVTQNEYSSVSSVFSLKNCLANSIRYNLCEEKYTKMETYMSNEGGSNDQKIIKFPQNNVQRLLAEEYIVRAGRIFDLTLPSVTPTYKQQCDELDASVRESSVDNVQYNTTTSCLKYEIIDREQKEMQRNEFKVSKTEMKSLRVDCMGLWRSKHLYLLFEPNTFVEGMREEYVQYQKKSIEDLKTRVWHKKTANISTPHKAIIKWEKTNKIKIKHYKFTSDLTVFGNMMQRRMEMYENVLLVCSTHRTLVQIMFGRLDAYRQTFDLHFNMYATGKHGTSKSFLFDKMGDMSIPNTITELTYQTKRSDAVDDDQNDTISIFHETPQEMLVRERNGDNSIESSFKEKLTSQRVKCKTMQMDDGNVKHKRGNRVTDSEQIGVVMGASNDPPSRVEPALLSRFFHTMFEDVYREHRNIIDLSGAEKNRTRLDQDKVDNLCKETQEEQRRHFMVEKLIFTKIIQDVEMGCATRVFLDIEAYIRKNSINTPHNRDYTRLHILARLLTINHALELVFNIPTGLHFDEVCTLDNIRDVEPYLVCTEEIALFTVMLMKEQYESPTQFKLLKALKRRFESISEDDKKYSVEGAGKMQRQQQDEESKPDYNRIRVPGNMAEVVKTLIGYIHVSEGKPSVDNMISVLKNMKQMLIKGYEYDSKKQKTDLTSQVEPVVETIVKHQSGYDFHYTLIDGLDENRDIVLDAVKHYKHSNTREQTVLLGDTYVENANTEKSFSFPQLFKKIQMGKTDRVQYTLNCRYASEISKEMTNCLVSEDMNKLLKKENETEIETIDEEWDTFFLKNKLAHLGMDVSQTADMYDTGEFITGQQKKYVRSFQKIEQDENEHMKNDIKRFHETYVQKMATISKNIKDFVNSKRRLDDNEVAKYNLAKRGIKRIRLETFLAGGATSSS